MNKFYFSSVILFLSSNVFAANENLSPTFTPIIDEVDGRDVYYSRYGEGYFNYGDKIYYYNEETDPSPAAFVFGDDNKVYIRDIMDIGNYTYTAGIKNGNKITVTLPQTLFIEEYTWLEYPLYYNLCVMTQTGTALAPSFVIDESVSSVTYTVSADGTITLDPLPEGKYLGAMTYNYDKDYINSDDDNEVYKWYSEWSGYADSMQKFIPLGQELIQMPKDVETYTFQVVLKGYNYPVTVAFKDNYIYIQGLGDSEASDNFVMRGEINGDKVSFPQNQYIGVFSWDNEMVVTKCGYPNNRGNIIYSKDDAGFEMTINQTKNVLSPVDPDMYLCFAYMNQFDSSTGQEGILYNYYFKDFDIIYQYSYPGIPSNPYNLVSNKNSDWLGIDTINFELQCFSTDNYVILSGNLYYSIYIDDELVLFEYEPAQNLGEVSKYYMLPEPTTEIPFLFTNNFEFYIMDEIEREVGYYIEGVTTVGVQAVYYCDGVRTVSDIVTLNLETGEITTTSGIDSIKGIVEVINVEYFNLSGQKVSNPEKGIFIKRSTLSNGKVISSKISLN